MNYTLFLSDIQNKVGLSDKNCVLIRHSLNDKSCKIAWDKGMEFFEEYQKIQPTPDYFKNHQYIMSFISAPGTSTRFIGCYEVNGSVDIKQITPMSDFPIIDMYDDNGFYFNIVKTDILSDLNNRLVIDWGKGTANILHMKCDNKPVLSISPKYEFEGYDRIKFKFDELVEIINNPLAYQAIHDALSSVYGVYLVTDMKDGKQYVGSAYGNDEIKNSVVSLS